MCAIIGVAGKTPAADQSWLAIARDVMRHRGPDGAGEWWSEDRRVGLGHRRLAIIDLSQDGRQPMHTPSGRLHVVFNGEIYNYRELKQELAERGYSFRSKSDTEVLLAAYNEWGSDCLSRLAGMFAFAIYDARRDRLFLARDRAGEKPVYYSLIEGTFRFASELKGLMADPTFPRRIDTQAFDCFLAHGFTPAGRSMLGGAHKLPAGHALSFDVAAGRLDVWRYWRIPEFAQTGEKADASALQDELEGLLEKAVRRQLVADVPVGVLLSGGVDSSVVTAMAARSAPKVKTFTIRFPAHGKFDETPHARLIARHFGTDHVELEAKDGSLELLPALARQFDEPIIDSSMIPTYLVSKLVREHCTVVLGGDGGDELFGGYGHYNRLLWLNERAACLPQPVRRALSALAQKGLPLGFKGRNWLQALQADWGASVPLIASYFDSSSRRQLLGAAFEESGVAEAIREAAMPEASDLLQRATRLDFESYLSGDILVKVDRASMLNSLEVRAPMLDPILVEFAFRDVPSKLKASANSRKLLLKKLAAKILPEGFDLQRKQGFSIPLDSWLAGGPWRDYFREVLLANDDGPFDRRFVEELFKTQARGCANGERLFGLVMFELWRREYGVSI